MQGQYQIRDLYNPHSEIYKRFLMKEEDLDSTKWDFLKNITLTQEFKEMEIIDREKTLRERVNGHLSLALLKGDARYVRVARYDNAMAKVGLKKLRFWDNEIEKVQHCLPPRATKFNKKWPKQAVRFIKELKPEGNDATFSALKEKINLACQKKLPPFADCQSYRDVRDKLSSDNMYVCYQYVNAIKMLKNKYHFVVLGGYNLDASEYEKPIVAKAKRYLKKDIDDQKLNKTISRLINTAVIRCTPNPYLILANKLKEKAKDKLDCEEKLKEVQELFASEKFKTDWATHASRFIRCKNSKLRKAIKSGEE